MSCPENSLSLKTEEWCTEVHRNAISLSWSNSPVEGNIKKAMIYYFTPSKMIAFSNKYNPRLVKIKIPQKEKPQIGASIR